MKTVSLGNLRAGTWVLLDEANPEPRRVTKVEHYATLTGVLVYSVYGFRHAGGSQDRIIAGHEGDPVAVVSPKPDVTVRWDAPRRGWVIDVDAHGSDVVINEGAS